MNGVGFAAYSKAFIYKKTSSCHEGKAENNCLLSESRLTGAAGEDQGGEVVMEDSWSTGPCHVA